MKVDPIKEQIRRLREVADKIDRVEVRTNDMLIGGGFVIGYVDVSPAALRELLKRAGPRLRRTEKIVKVK